jgi:hypothetical protein
LERVRRRSAVTIWSIRPVTKTGATRPLFAREHDMALAIRGGVHHGRGFGAWDDALVIDLGGLQSITVTRQLPHKSGGSSVRRAFGSSLKRKNAPKGTDLSFWGPGYLIYVAAELNNRPRQLLGWTPQPKPSIGYCPIQRISKCCRDRVNPLPVVGTFTSTSSQ